MENTIKSEEFSNQSEEEAILQQLTDLNLSIEVCGSWIWVSGDTQPYAKLLKELGFWWAPKKQCWYKKPDGYFRRKNPNPWSMDKIRDIYGSNTSL